VSEDFDQALRLQIAGFIIRLASYHHGGFEEGVSLTVFDELARWEKYTYGCNELLFHPFRKWITKGPFTPLLWRLIRSNVKSSSKITIIGYVFTYYAMAAALPFCLLNYFLEGWIADMLDHYYLDSFRIMILLLVVFNVLVSTQSELSHRLPTANRHSVTTLIQLPPRPPRPRELLPRPRQNIKMDAPLHGLLWWPLNPPLQSHLLSFL
jgi:hypothetical protein